MSLAKAVGTIAGFTLLSRIFGFARDILLARVLGAGLAADAYQLAFRLPNTFRRLFAEGAFSVAFVPMYSRKLHEDGGGEDAAERFTNEVVSVFVWILLGFTGLAMLAMPWIVWALASDFQTVPGKFDLAVLLSRLTFPYLALISMVSLLSGLLNARSRFAPGAFAPVLFNLTLISGIIAGWWLRGDSDNDRIVVIALAISVSISGLVQMIYLWWCVRRANLSLRIGRPRMTGDVKRLGALILPATFGAGIYQISQFVDTFFATSLPQGSLTLLSMADRLNQMPLGIVGIALGTAILPMLSRALATDDQVTASRIQTNAVELAMLLTLPAAVALGVCAPAFVNAFFVGGKFTSENGVVTAQIVMGLVAGLPAYVLVKILTPGYFARGDTRTPVVTAAIALAFNICLILVLIKPYGVVGLAMAGAVSAWLNTILLYCMLRWRGHFRLQSDLIGRLLRQVLAAAAMAGVLWWLNDQLAAWFLGNIWQRIGGMLILVSAGMVTYFAIGFLVGAIDRERLALILKRRGAKAEAVSNTQD